MAFHSSSLRTLFLLVVGVLLEDLSEDLDTDTVEQPDGEADNLVEEPDGEASD